MVPLTTFFRKSSPYALMENRDFFPLSFPLWTKKSRFSPYRSPYDKNQFRLPDFQKFSPAAPIPLKKIFACGAKVPLMSSPYEKIRLPLWNFEKKSSPYGSSPYAKLTKNFPLSVPLMKAFPSWQAEKKSHKGKVPLIGHKEKKKTMRSGTGKLRLDRTQMEECVAPSIKVCTQKYA